MDIPIVVVLIVAMAFFLVFYLVFSASRYEGKKRIPNYKALFVIGVTWFPIGIATKNPSLWGLGVVFMIIGALNKNKWGQETKWADLSPQVKRIKLIVIAVLTIVLLAAIGYYFVMK